MRHLLSRIVIIVVIIKTEKPVAIESLFSEIAQFSSFTLGGTAQTLSPIHKTADCYYIEQVILALRRQVLKILGNKTGSKAVFGKTFDSKRICHRRLAYVYNVANLNGARRLGGRRILSTHTYTPFATCIGTDGASLENTHGPQPFVQTNFLFWHIFNISSLRTVIFNRGRAVQSGIWGEIN